MGEARDRLELLSPGGGGNAAGDQLQQRRHQASTRHTYLVHFVLIARRKAVLPGGRSTTYLVKLSHRDKL